MLRSYVDAPWLATGANGDIVLWDHFIRGADYGGGTPNSISYGLVRYSADGRFLWIRPASCSEANPRMDAAGNVTVLQMAGCQSEAQTEFLERFSPLGERLFAVSAANSLRMLYETHVVSPEGASLVGGRRVGVDWTFAAEWSLLGADGSSLASGRIAGADGILEPLQLSADGQYLAVLHIWDGSGTFAGQPVTCIRDENNWCTPLLIHGNVDGREYSVGRGSNEERILWTSPSREIVTHALDAAGTGVILRRRSSTGRLLSTYALPSLGPTRSEFPSELPTVSVSQVVALPEGGLLVLGTLVGEAELGGTHVSASRSRLFLLRVAAFTPASSP